MRALYSLCYAIRDEAPKKRIEDALDCSMLELGQAEESLPKPEIKEKPDIQKTPVRQIEVILRGNSLTQDDIYEIMKLILTQDIEDKSL